MLGPKLHQLRAAPETVKWGFLSNLLEPVLRVKSGDIVYLETISHHAGDAAEFMMDGRIKEIYDAIPIEERGPGVHILTGPIYVEGAQPGDVLECRILNLRARLPYGINFAANWGLLYEDFSETEYVTLFEVDEKTNTAQAVFYYKFPGILDKPGPITHLEARKKHPILRGVRVPLKYHFGTAGVVPKQKGIIDSVPPGIFGGNIDNRDFNVGTSMYYPVQVEGALFVAGDPHLAQGHGEIAGTAIEGHLNATIQLLVRDNIKINNPVLETPTHWITHAFDKDLNEGIRLAAMEMIEFLVNNWELSEIEAYTLLSVAGDFSITQVVNQEQGIHCSLRKDVLPSRRNSRITTVNM